MKNKKTIITKVEKGLKVALENKMNSYKRETSYMPFMEGIFGKKNTAIYSFFSKPRFIILPNGELIS